VIFSSCFRLLASNTGEMMISRNNSGKLAVFLSVLFLVPVFSAALKQAAREKKFIVLDISASW
jgi:hypothetical protein